MERGVPLSKRQPGQAARLLVDDGASAAGGLALDEALLLDYHRASPPPAPTLRLYTYADNCVLIGRYQNLSAEVDLQAAESLGVGVSRRPTGGGAIIMGSKQLGVAVAAAAESAERPKDVLSRYARGVVGGLGNLGIEASFEGKNDLVVAGRKIAGLGLYADGRGGLLFHASVLADLDIDLMLSVLQIPASKLSANRISAVQQRIVTVSSILGEAVDAGSLRGAFAAGFGSSLGCDLLESVPTDQERAEAARLEADKYGTAEWCQQQHFRQDQTSSFDIRSTEGTLRCHVSLSGNILKSLLITGDFNTMPPVLKELESALRWQRVDPEPLAARLRSTLGDPALVDADEFVDHLVRLAGATLAPAGAQAAPSRTGSCYFPEVSAT